MEKNSFIFFVTAPSMKEARKIGNYMVKHRIAACANLIHNIDSIYRWKGKIEKDMEVLILLKTTENKVEKLKEAIESIHSYETPECVGIKIEKGSEKYLKWLNKMVNED